MKVLSVNVGLPREVEWKGITVSTAIFKEPVAGPVAVRRDNLDGDRQADLTVHGGPNKAVYGYASEHYPYWRKQLPNMELPCYKLQIRFGRDDIIQRFLVSGRSGFYFSIVEPGEVEAGSVIEVVSRDENQVTIADIHRLYLGVELDPELLQRALRVPVLPEGLRGSLVKRGGW